MKTAERAHDGNTEPALGAYPTIHPDVRRMLIGMLTGKTAESNPVAQPTSDTAPENYRPQQAILELTYAGFTYDLVRRTLQTPSGKTLPTLKPMEKKLAVALIIKEGGVVGPHEVKGRKTLRALSVDVCGLRKALGVDSTRIETVRNQGYRLSEPQGNPPTA